VKDVALHIASPSAPRFLTRDEVPQDEIDQERRFAECRPRRPASPNVIEKIVEGRSTPTSRTSCCSISRS
jgi:elongation factor Ts